MHIWINKWAVICIVLQQVISYFYYNFQELFWRRYFPGGCWWICKMFCDASERLFMKRFMSTEDRNIISQLKIETSFKKLNDPKVRDSLRRYIQVKSKGLNGHYGKTLQYWLTPFTILWRSRILSLKSNAGSSTRY